MSFLILKILQMHFHWNHAKFINTFIEMKILISYFTKNFDFDMLLNVFLASMKMAM